MAQAAISDRARRKSVKVGPDVSYGARTSDVLTVLASQEGERLTVADIVAVLRDRAFALLVVLLGLPNCLPMPPPIPLVCGLLLLLVALGAPSAHAADPLAADSLANGGEAAILYCFGFLYLAAAGGGRWSVDAMRWRG